MPSSRRCSTCATNWPAITPTYQKCPICGSPADHMDVTTVLTQKEAQQLVDAHNAPEAEIFSGSIHSKQVYEWRFGRFMDLGFGPREAADLAESREDIHSVKKMLTQGCGIETAVAILL